MWKLDVLGLSNDMADGELSVAEPGGATLSCAAWSRPRLDVVVRYEEAVEGI